jgi:hypothetical protein
MKRTLTLRYTTPSTSSPSRADTSTRDELLRFDGELFGTIATNIISKRRFPSTGHQKLKGTYINLSIGHFSGAREITIDSAFIRVLRGERDYGKISKVDRCLPGKQVQRLPCGMVKGALTIPYKGLHDYSMVQYGSRFRERRQEYPQRGTKGL